MRDVYNALPAILRENLEFACMVGFWIGSVVAIWVLQDQFVNEDYRVSFLGGTVSWWQVPIVLASLFGPPLVFNLFYQKSEAMFNRIAISTHVGQEKSVLMESSCFLVIAYLQDEALLALSVIMNVMSLTHQIVFAFVLAFSRLLSRTKILDAAWSAPWIVLGGILLLIPLGFSGTVLIHTIAGLWPSLHENFDIFERGIEFVFRYQGAVAGVVAGIGFVFVGAIGLLCLVVVLSMVLMGLGRIGVLSMAGVIDQIRDRDTFLDGVFGNVWVSMIPLGHTESVMLHGKGLFVHVKIYNDERVIVEIAKFIMQRGLVRQG